MTTSGRQTTRTRQRAMLQTAMGPAIATALMDPDVLEVMASGRPLPAFATCG